LCFNDIGEDVANNYAREEVRNKEMAMPNHNTSNKKALCPRHKHPPKNGHIAKITCLYQTPS
jgi:hypothetical protein